MKKKLHAVDDILRKYLNAAENYKLVLPLLFDVHCQGQYLSNRSEIEKEHNLLCVGHHIDLPQDMVILRLQIIL